MSRGWVICRYVGGPWDGKVEELAAIYCRDTMGVEGEVWIRENPDGSAGVIKGPRGPAWVSFNPSVYEKTPQSQGGTRGNVQIRAYDKCESLRKVLPAKGRRCKNAALEGKELRRDHEKIRARTKTERP